MEQPGLRAVTGRRWLTADELREAVRESNGDLIPRPVVLHVHLPGRGRCALCGVRWNVAPADPAQAWEALLNQLDRLCRWTDADRLCSAMELVMPAIPLPGIGRALRRLRRRVGRPGRRPVARRRRGLAADVLAIGPGARGRVGALRWRNAAAAQEWLSSARGAPRLGRLMSARP